MWFEEDHVSLFAGKRQVLKCTTWGFPTPSIKWLKDGVVLAEWNAYGSYPMPRKDVLRNSILYFLRTPTRMDGKTVHEVHFYNLELGHAGNYTCEAKNNYYTRRRNITVYVSCMNFTFNCT